MASTCPCAYDTLVHALPPCAGAAAGYFFPYNAFVRWLSYGCLNSASASNRDYFLKREFSFTLPGDIYTRYRCYANEEEFKKALIATCPSKIDVGAVYTFPVRDCSPAMTVNPCVVVLLMTLVGWLWCVQPAQHKTISAELFKPHERELVFDIDMTDYDTIRTCCTGAKTCSRCWQFMTAAIKVMDATLRGACCAHPPLRLFATCRGRVV